RMLPGDWEKPPATIEERAALDRNLGEIRDRAITGEISPQEAIKQESLLKSAEFERKAASYEKQGLANEAKDFRIQAEVLKKGAGRSAKVLGMERSAVDAASDREARMRQAEGGLGRDKPLSPAEREAVWKAHLVGADRPGAGIGKYTEAEIHQKIKILTDAGF